MKKFILLYLLLSGPIPSSWADVGDVDGDQSGRYDWKAVYTYTLNTRNATIRLPVPTVNLISATNETNEFHLIDNAPGTGVSVLNMDGTAANWRIAQTYNFGLASAGMWIWVFNPDTTAPYAPYNFQLVLAVTDVNYVYGYRIIKNISKFSPGTNFTNPTEDIDSTSLAVTDAVTAALTQTGLFHVGNLGEIERFQTYYVKRYNFVPTYEAKASLILAQPIGGLIDCDGSVNARCAMMRNRGFPCRALITGTVGSSNNLFSNTRGIHSIGEFWNGSKWVDFEGQRAENFAHGGQVFLTAVEDLNYGYFQSSGSPPADLISASYIGSKSITNSSTFSVLETRNIGSTDPNKMLFSRLSIANPAPGDIITPHDSLGVPNPSVDVPNLSLPTGLSIISLQNPAKNSIQLSVSIPEQSSAEVALFDVTGKKVTVLAPKGIYQPTFSISSPVSNLPPGQYFAQLNWKGNSVSTKITLIR